MQGFIHGCTLPLRARSMYFANDNCGTSYVQALYNWSVLTVATGYLCVSNAREALILDALMAPMFIWSIGAHKSVRDTWNFVHCTQWTSFSQGILLTHIIPKFVSPIFISLRFYCTIIWLKGASDSINDLLTLFWLNIKILHNIWQHSCPCY